MISVKRKPAKVTKRLIEDGTIHVQRAIEQ